MPVITRNDIPLRYLQNAERRYHEAARRPPKFVPKDSEKSDYRVEPGHVLVLRCLHSNSRIQVAQQSFVPWPEWGSVEDPYFDADPSGRVGLYGLLWARGKPGLMQPKALNQIGFAAIDVLASEGFDRGHEFRFRRGEIVFRSYSLDHVLAFMERHRPAEERGPDWNPADIYGPPPRRPKGSAAEEIARAREAMGLPKSRQRQTQLRRG